MALKANTFEGGSNGTGLQSTPTNNTGGASGDQFDLVTVNTGTITWTNAVKAHGAMSCAVTVPGATTTFVTYSGYSTTQMVARFYVYFGALPGANGPVRLAEFRTGSASVTRVVVDASNRFLLQTNNGTTTLKTFAALSAGTWYRVEMATTTGTSGATVKMDYYVGDSATPVEAGFTTSAANTGVTANITQFQVGVAASTTGALTLFLDDVAALDGTLTYIGVPSTPPTASYTRVRAGLTLSVDGSASRDSAGNPVASYSWNFGDGSAAVTGATAQHSYAAANSYTVVLTVTDGSGQTSTSSKSITIEAPAGTVGPESVDVSTGWTVVGAADALTALTDGDLSTYMQATAPSSLELDVTLKAAIPPTPGNPYRLLITTDAQLSVNAQVNVQMFEGTTQRSAVTGVVIPSGAGSSVGSTIAANFPWTDVSAMSTGGWNAPRFKAQYTAS